MLDTSFYEHPYHTDTNIFFMILLINMLIVSCFGSNHQKLLTRHALRLLAFVCCSSNLFLDVGGRFRPLPSFWMSPYLFKQMKEMILKAYLLFAFCPRKDTTTSSIRKCKYANSTLMMMVCSSSSVYSIWLWHVLTSER